MPYHEFLWMARAITKVADNGLTIEDVEFAVLNAFSEDISRSTGRPIYLGETPDGRVICVVYDSVDETQIAVVTAYVIAGD